MEFVFGGAALVFAIALSYVNRRIGFKKGVHAAQTVVYVFAKALQDDENE